MNVVSVRLMGGLGNMMFQIATAFSLSIRDKSKFVCCTNNMVVAHKPCHAYMKNIFKKIEFSNLCNFSSFVSEGMEYREIPKFVSDVLLIGYFQSEKYFIDHRKEILELFEINPEDKNYLEKKYGFLSSDETCSIHIRRGDYIGLEKFHPILPMEYYLSSIKLVGQNKHFIIFSDDIEWCEENFSFLEKKTFIKGNEDFQDMYLMSLCKDNIIANSTFSWWGAWLNQNKNKKVVIPASWFGPSYKHLKTEDLYCENWIKLK